MAENPSPSLPIQSSNPASDGIQPSNATNPILSSPPMAPSPSVEIAQISSPQMALTQQQQQQPQLQQFNSPLQQQQLQQQQNLMAANFQIQSMQRSTSMPRMTHLQQQQMAMRQAGVYGQMNFGGSGGPQLQQQVQQLGGGMSRSMLMGQVGQTSGLPMLPGQGSAAPATVAQFNLLAPQRQKAGLVQGSPFHATNSSGQHMQGMQAIGMMNSLGLNSQLRSNGAAGLANQRLQLMRQHHQQQISQASLTSPQKLHGQGGLPRTSSLASMNPPLSGLTQNGQSAMLQSSLSQQEWVKQMPPTHSVPASPSYHIQQQRRALSQQQLPSSPQLQKSTSLNQQSISQLVHQPQLGTQQQVQPHQHQQQLPLQPQQQFSQQQQQQQQQQHSPKIPGSTVQNPVSLTCPQSENNASGTTTPGGSSSQGTEASNQLLGKRKMHDLVAQVDSRGKLDPEVEYLLLGIADDFIDSVTSFACSLAKHRKSSTLESKDLLLHLENNWHLMIPGFSSEEKIKRRKQVKSMMDSSHLVMDATMPKDLNRTGIGHSVNGDHSVKPSAATEQLVSPSLGSPLLQKMTQF